MHLYIHNADPVSVQVLAAGGVELAQALAAVAGEKPFRETAIGTNPKITEKAYDHLRKKYWNAFKHATHMSGKERNDDALLDRFSDEENAGLLMIGWVDLDKICGHLPVEAQAFQAWYLARKPDQFPQEEKLFKAVRIFPNLKMRSTDNQKEDLRGIIKTAYGVPTIMDHPRTDKRPLLLGNDIWTLRVTA